MASYNKVIMVGNLTRDPALSYLPSQTAVCEIGLAVNNKWRDKDGQQREDVCFIDCRCFGKQAETLAKYMAKGRQLLVEGRLELDQWETPDGQKRSKHRVFITGYQFLDSKDAKAPSEPPAKTTAWTPPAPHQPPMFPPAGPDDPAGEDIPF